MAKDDFEVIIFKVLTYFYSCLKAGVQANIEKAHEVAACNDVYWAAVLEDLFSNGYLSGTVFRGWHGPHYLDMRITSKGAEYLKGSSKMAAVRKFLGKAFEAVIEGAVAATMAL